MLIDLRLKSSSLEPVSPPGNDSFRKTCVLLQTFFLFQSRDLRDASADRRGILHGDEYWAKFYNACPKFRTVHSPPKNLGAKNMQNLARFRTVSNFDCEYSKSDKYVIYRNSSRV